MLLTILSTTLMEARESRMRGSRRFVLSRSLGGCWWASDVGIHLSESEWVVADVDM